MRRVAEVKALDSMDQFNKRLRRLIQPLRFRTHARKTNAMLTMGTWGRGHPPSRGLTRLTDLEDLHVGNQPQHDCRVLLTSGAALQLFVRESARRIPNSTYWTLESRVSSFGTVTSQVQPLSFQMDMDIEHLNSKQ